MQNQDKLSGPIAGALAGGGDPATSALYVFGPFLRLIVPAGVAGITFGPSVWLVVITVAVVSLMYRLVMRWVTDGTGGSGLSEDEFGPTVAKMNASLTFIEYSLTFLVSMAALVTFLVDRIPTLTSTIAGIDLRLVVAVALSAGTAAVVARGPRIAAMAFGPATAGVLLLLFTLMGATVWRYGLRLPGFSLRAFQPDLIGFTLGGFARILALMTGIEVFANLVAAYDGNDRTRSRNAFWSLVIIMGTTSATMLIVGPAILELSDPLRDDVSVFTQTMDALLPQPLAYLGTGIGVAVLLSACATALQGIAHLGHGLQHRHYLPPFLGRTNRHGIAARMLWLETTVAGACFALLGTREETYLTLYAAGVFVLLSSTGWAAARRLSGRVRQDASSTLVMQLAGVGVAASMTSVATVIVFYERFRDGVWLYFLLVPLLHAGMSAARRILGAPDPEEDLLGRRIACSCPTTRALACSCHGCLPQP